MEKVCYILGAGFSAPLGLPVMSNFLSHARDLYTTDPEEYSSFKRVFDEIREMHICKTYYAADLLNIEEILSILEMKSFVDKNTERVEFADFILKLIDALTPSPLDPHRSFPGNWNDFVFGNDEAMRFVGSFVAALLRVRIRRMKSRLFEIDQHNDGPRYSVISLNYDMILEDIADSTNRAFSSAGHEAGIRFEREGYDPTWNRTNLAKLHGSVDDDTVVPPTWRKGNADSVIPAWDHARKILRDCSHIRILGYSLPESDNYIRYLLKSSVVDSSNLKTIDAICLDWDGSVERRFRDFFIFRDFRFKNADILSCFKGVFEFGRKRHQVEDPICDEVRFARLESAHTLFMETDR
jgi:hypothetical protein